MDWHKINEVFFDEWWNLTTSKLLVSQFRKSFRSLESDNTRDFEKREQINKQQNNVKSINEHQSRSVCSGERKKLKQEKINRLLCTNLTAKIIILASIWSRKFDNFVVTFNWVYYAPDGFSYEASTRTKRIGVYRYSAQVKSRLKTLNFFCSVMPSSTNYIKQITVSKMWNQPYWQNFKIPWLSLYCHPRFPLQVYQILPFFLLQGWVRRLCSQGNQIYIWLAKTLAARCLKNG